PVRARLVTEPYRRILKTPGYAGGYLFCVSTEYLYLAIIFDGRGRGFLAYFKNKELNLQLSG
ncbi:hypothetical protein, partial [Morganella morganii]|uniref:hypothetical protein n=1 Tax=Morganella morganii TaxID=582 RepID=UPI0034E54F43